MYMTSQDLLQSQMRESWKRLWIWGKKMRVKGFKIWLLKLIDTTPEKWTEAHLMAMSASEPVPHDKKEGIEEAVPENKLTLGNLAEGFWLFKTTFDFFYDTEPSMTVIWALKPKEMVRKELVPYRNNSREMEKQNIQMEITKYTECICLSCLPFHFLSLLCFCHLGDSKTNPSLSSSSSAYSMWGQQGRRPLRWSSSPWWIDSSRHAV